MVGLIADVQVLTPPRQMLGRFTEAGQAEQIAQWVRSQDLRSVDAVIISVDMLAYGGLVSSRVYRTPISVARDRLELASWIRRTAAHLPIYANSVIMRLAPTAEPGNEAYREKLARWAEISPEAAKNAKLKEEVKRLEKEIPPAALADYKRARERNLAINLACIDLVRDRTLDYLILSQDDARPRGVHIGDRQRLAAEVERLGLEDKISIQPGADEVSMLLLARALSERFSYHPRITIIYSSEKIRNSIAPFEDRPLCQTVSHHLAATGAREAQTVEAADILFFIYGSRAEAGAAVAFAERIASYVEQGHRVIVADIDFSGSVQGADPAFTRELLKRKLILRLAGYASWNTAANTIGTALPQGIAYTLALERLAKGSSASAQSLASTQIKFLLHRLIDDYAYHSLVRPEAINFARKAGLNPNSLTGKGQALVESFIGERVRSHADNLCKDLTAVKLIIPNSSHNRIAVSVIGISGFTIHLPWGRTFEAEIEFDIKTAARLTSISLSSKKDSALVG
jgi:hypothetical protein